MIEAVAFCSFGHAREDIVNPQIDRLQQICSDASVCAVRCNKDGYSVETHHHQNDENDKQRIADPTVFPDETKAIFLDLAGHKIEAVLHHAKGTRHRAVKPSKEEGYKQDGCNDDETRREYGRQKLELGHPAKIGVERSGEI